MGTASAGATGERCIAGQDDRDGRASPPGCYNIVSVGYIWEEARRRPLAAALAVAVPRST